MEYQIDPKSPDYRNVTEYYELHDTVCIGLKSSPDVEERVPGWFPSYNAFGQKATHTFFNVRNIGEAQLAYNNLDTKDQMPFVFHVYSIGLNFIAPPGLPEPEVAEANFNPVAHVLFAQTIQNHVGVKLKIREDEKLKNNGMLCPEGAGTYGNAVSFGGGVNTLSVTAVTPGMPNLQNRFPFPDPIEVPRGATYSVEVELSKYAQDLLTALPGPSFYGFDNGSGPVAIPARAMVRCSLIGKRAVQQRGELHY